MFWKSIEPGQDILNNICGQICGSDIQLPQGGRLVPLRRHHLVRNRILKPAFFSFFHFQNSHALQQGQFVEAWDRWGVYTCGGKKNDRFVNLINMNEDVTE